MQGDAFRATHSTSRRRLTMNESIMSRERESNKEAVRLCATDYSASMGTMSGNASNASAATSSDDGRLTTATATTSMGPTVPNS